MTTPQGLTAAATFENLLAGKILLDTGRVPLPGDASDRVTQLAAVAAQDAMDDAAWLPAEVTGPRTALVVGTSKGPIERWVRNPSGGAVGSLFGLSEVGSDVIALLRISPHTRLTFSGACASSLHALIRAQALIERDQCDRVLVLAAESSISDFFHATFQRLGVLAPPGYGCRPFDRDRRGFTLSEAAAAVCLEHRPRGAGIAIERSMMLADAHHLTATDPDATALRYLLRHLSGTNAIDVVHAHGTGTALNDPAELSAIDTLTDQHPPAVYSHKAALGHTQGAAGLLSIAINVCIHRGHLIPPNAATRNPLQTRSANVRATPSVHTCGSSIAVAAGFGGPVGGVSMVCIGG